MLIHVALYLNRHDNELLTLEAFKMWAETSQEPTKTLKKKS